MTAKFQAQVSAAHLCAMALLASTQDVRYYLNGVLVEASPEVVLVATDGNALGMLDTGQMASGLFKVLVPHPVIKEFAKSRGVLTLTSEDGKAWTASADGKVITWTYDGAQYPDARRALPRSSTGEIAQFDVRLIGRFYQVHLALGGSKKELAAVLVAPSGHSATALVHLPGFPEFVGGMVPLRAPPAVVKVRDSLPDWVHRTHIETCDLA